MAANHNITMESNPTFYSDGTKRMVAEGMEAMSKIMASIKDNKETLSKLSPEARKKAVLEYESAKLFNQIHPIVFHYMAVEGIFNAHAFRRYVMSVYGKPKSAEDQERMRGNKKLVYQFKNAQQALYYKYLLIETNPNVSKTTLHSMYEDVVAALNKDTDSMLDSYEKAQEEAKMVEEELTQAKREDLVEMLKKKIQSKQD